jgi:hypothetical protein
VENDTGRRDLNKEESSDEGSSRYRVLASTLL